MAFPRPEANFGRYRERVRDYLRQTSMPQRAADDIELNLPFERSASPDVPFRGRFLLLHGLNDSPYVWHDLADVLVARGFDVRAPLFEGHGSTPRAMLEVSHRSWLRDARRQAELWSSSPGPLYIGGFSLGGVIATVLALERPSVQGLFLISPAYHSKLNGYLRWAGLYSMVRPWIFGGMILEDNPIKYNSIPVNSGWQFFKTTRLLKRRWNNQRLDMPVLLVATSNDSVVDTDYTIRLFKRRFTHPASRLLLYSPEVTAGAQDSRIVRRQSAFLDQRILNQSHLGLMYAPDNPLFGRDGRVLVCNGNEYPIFMACMRSQRHWFGAQHTASPDGTAVARTTYNPDHAAVVAWFDTLFVGQ